MCIRDSLLSTKKKKLHQTHTETKKLFYDIDNAANSKVFTSKVDHWVSFQMNVVEIKNHILQHLKGERKAYKVRWGGSPHGAIVLFDYSTLNCHDFQSRPHSPETQPNDPPHLQTPWN